MSTATITSKGQVTIPAAVRNELKIAPGDRIEFIKISSGHFEIVKATKDARELRGIVKSNKVVSIDEMNIAIKNRVVS